MNLFLKVSLVAFAFLTFTATFSACTRRSVDAPGAASVADPTPATTPVAIDYAAPKPVGTPNKCDRALDAVPVYTASAPMFKNLYAFYVEFGDCMDGVIASGVSDAIVQTLDANWSELSKFNDLIKKTPGFKGFIISSIEVETNGRNADVLRIIQHAKKNCPKGLAGLCGEIKTRAEDALKAEIDGD